jgi:dTMP kinase
MSKMIVIDGLDGSGKATQAEILTEYLKAKGYETYTLDLPFYSDASSTLVKMYLGGELGDNPNDVNAYAASTFYAADRYASFKKYWEKEYLSDKIIVANRYTTSNACHQMTKLPKEEWDEYLDWLFDTEYNKLGLPSPETVIYLDVPVEVSAKLIAGRAETEGRKKDIHELDTAYLVSCREAARYACQKMGWTVVECSENGEMRSIDEIFSEILNILNL